MMNEFQAVFNQDVRIYYCMDYIPLQVLNPPETLMDTKWDFT